MQELKAKLTPADGSGVREIIVRIGDPEQGQESWSVRMEIMGFDDPFSRVTYGEDWAQAIELAAMVLPVILQRMVGEVGGGKLEPSFYPRDPQPPDLSKLPEEVTAILAEP